MWPLFQWFNLKNAATLRDCTVKISFKTTVPLAPCSKGKPKEKKLKTDRNKTYGLTVASDPDQDRVDFVKIRPIKILRPNSTLGS